MLVWLYPFVAENFKDAPRGPTNCIVNLDHLSKEQIEELRKKLFGS